MKNKISFAEYVKNNIGQKAEDIARFFAADIESEASKANILWFNSFGDTVLETGRFSCPTVKVATSSDYSRVNVFIELKEFEDKYSKERFEYPMISFKNYRVGFPNSESSKIATSSFNSLEALFNEYNSFVDTGEIKKRKPPQTNQQLHTLKQLSPEELIEARRKERDADHNAFVKMLPLLHKKAFSPKLASKKVEDVAKAFDIRVGKNGFGYFTAIPVQNFNGQFLGLQRQYHKAKEKKYEKIFTKHLEVEGCFFLVGNDELLNSSERFYITESLANGLSIYLATGLPVFVSFNAWNISAVHREIKSRYPGTQVVIAADNDCDDKTRNKNKRGNPGLFHAVMSVQKYGGWIYLPDMGNHVKCDANDIHAMLGIEALKEQMKDIRNYLNKSQILNVSGYFNLI